MPSRTSTALGIQLAAFDLGSRLLTGGCLELNVAEVREIILDAFFRLPVGTTLLFLPLILSQGDFPGFGARQWFSTWRSPPRGPSENKILTLPFITAAKSQS